MCLDGRPREKFSVFKGLRQGDPLFTSSFIIVLEKAVRESELKTKGTV